MLDNDETFPVEQTVGVESENQTALLENEGGYVPGRLNNSNIGASEHGSKLLESNDLTYSGAGTPSTKLGATDDINILGSEMPMSPGGAARKSFFNRSFGKLEKGGVRNSAFLLCNAAVGGGVLSLPYMFVLSGWLTGYILLSVSAIAGTWSNLMLAQLAIAHRKNNYNEIVLLAGGPKLQKALQIMLLIYLFGACTGYQIIQTQMVAYICNQFGVPQTYTDTMKFRAMVNIPLDALIVVPLSAMRDMSSLAFLSLLTVLALVYVAILLLIEWPWYSQEFKAMELYERNIVVLDWNFLQACSMTFFAYTCQVQLLPIYSELVRPSYKRIKKVVVYSLFTDFLVYAVVSTAGYFSTYNYTNPIVIYRPALPSYDPDYTMILCAVGILIVMISSYPCNYNPWRQAFFVFMLKMPDFSDTLNWAVTITFAAFSCLISILVPNVSQVLSILGGLCSVTLCYLIPTICWVKLSEHKWSHKDNLGPIVFFGTFVVLGYLSVVATVYNIVMGQAFIGTRSDIQYQSLIQ